MNCFQHFLLIVSQSDLQGMDVQSGRLGSHGGNCVKQINFSSSAEQLLSITTLNNVSSAVCKLFGTNVLL